MYPDRSRSSPDGLRIHVASCSDQGRVRTQNEDALALCEPSDQKQLAQLGYLYLLADGAGGHAAGEVASRIAVETIATEYYQPMASENEAMEELLARSHVTDTQGFLPDLDLPCKQVICAFHQAHTRICQLADLRYDYRGMVTTCLAAIVKERQMLIAHLGDSRAYLVRSSPKSPPAVTCLTTDHSRAMELTKAGLLTASQVRSSPSRHILARALGEPTRNPAGPDIITGELQAGDILVLCCDGLWSALPEERIALVVTAYPPQAACAELVRLANEAGGKDNISVIVLAWTERDRGT